MISPTFLRHLSLFCCPVSGQPLTVLDPAELAAANAAIQAKGRLHRGGSEVPADLDDAIGTADRRYLYRIAQDIAWLLPDLALVTPADAQTSNFASEKQAVQSFYDDFGWVKSSAGLFNDTVEFTDTRGVSHDYRVACNARIGRWLKGGVALVDAASGAIPHPEYLDLSRNYQVRICVDFSIRALREARAKLGEKGLYVLGDLTCLPFATGAIDTVMSLHTVYHVPRTEQTRAIDELVRVCKPGGRVVVVYVWGYSAAMHTLFAIRGFFGKIKRLGRPPNIGQAPAGGSPSLYFSPQNYDWFARELAPRHRIHLRVWSAISSTFQDRFIPENGRGRFTIGLVQLVERLFPRLSGRFGQYPLFVVEKK